MAPRKITGTLRCPPLRILQSVQFNEDLAKHLVKLGLSGDGTVDWVLTQFYDNFEGKLIDYNGNEIDIETRLVDNDFGQDTRRRVNAYKERASRRFQRRLQSDLVDRVMWLHFARLIQMELDNAK